MLNLLTLIQVFGAPFHSPIEEVYLSVIILLLSGWVSGSDRPRRRYISVAQLARRPVWNGSGWSAATKHKGLDKQPHLHFINHFKSHHCPQNDNNHKIAT